MVKTSFKLGDFDYVSIEIELTDHVRGEEKASAAIDRVYGLVEAKVAEKAQKYIGDK